METVPDRGQDMKHRFHTRSPFLESTRCSISLDAHRSPRSKGPHDAPAPGLLKMAQWRLMALNIWTAAVLATLRWRIGTVGRQDLLPRMLVVSVTSYPLWLATLPLTVGSQLCQTVKLDRIVRRVSNDDDPEIPEAVRRLTSFGVVICPTEGIQSLKKTIPSVGAIPDPFTAMGDNASITDHAGREAWP